MQSHPRKASSPQAYLHIHAIAAAHTSGGPRTGVSIGVHACVELPCGGAAGGARTLATYTNRWSPHMVYSMRLAVASTARGAARAAVMAQERCNRSSQALRRRLSVDRRSLRCAPLEIASG